MTDSKRSAKNSVIEENYNEEKIIFTKSLVTLFLLFSSAFAAFFDSYSSDDKSMLPFLFANYIISLIALVFLVFSKIFRLYNFFIISFLSLVAFIYFGSNLTIDLINFESQSLMSDITFAFPHLASIIITYLWKPKRNKENSSYSPR